MRESLSVTNRKACWVMPSEYMKVQPAPMPAISMSFLDKDVESLPLLHLSSGTINIATCTVPQLRGQLPRVVYKLSGVYYIIITYDAVTIQWHCYILKLETGVVGVVSFKCSDSKKLEEVLVRQDSTVLHVDIFSTLVAANKVECVELCISCGKQQRRCHL